MAVEMVRVINEATKQVWPHVQEALDVELEETAAAQIEGYLEKNRSNKEARRPRKVVAETIWVMRREGLLRTPQDAAVIKAAHDWYECGPDSTDEEIDAAEEALENAVRALPDYS